MAEPGRKFGLNINPENFCDLNALQILIFSIPSPRRRPGSRMTSALIRELAPGLRRGDGAKNIAY
jgi:hypothetical protein